MFCKRVRRHDPSQLKIKTNKPLLNTVVTFITCNLHTIIMFLIPVTQLQSFASQKFCKLPFLSHPHPSFCTWRNHLFFFFFCLLFCTAKSMLKKWRVDLLHTSCNTIFNLWAWGPNILNHSKKKWILKSKCWAESLLLFLPKSEVIKWKSCNSNPHHWHFKIMQTGLPTYRLLYCKYETHS